MILNPSFGSLLPSSWPETWRGLCLGLTLGAFPLGQFLFSPILGALSDRFGRRRILLTSLSIACLGHAFTAWSLMSHHWILLVICRGLTGCAESHVGVARSMMADLHPTERAFGFGAVIAMTELGFIVGPLFSATLLASGYGPDLPFTLAALITALVAVLTLILLPETHAPSQTSSPMHIMGSFNLNKRLKHLCQLAPLKWVFICGTLYTISADFFYNFIPAWMTVHRHMHAQDIAACNAFFSISAALAALLTGWLFKRIRPIKLGVLCCFGMGTGFMLIAQPLSTPVFYACTALITALFGIAGTYFTLEASERTDNDHQGEVLGTQQGLHTSGDALVALLGGSLLSLGHHLPFVCATLCAFASALLTWQHLQDKDARRSPRRNPDHG